jgi:hypothetical protein
VYGRSENTPEEEAAYDAETEARHTLNAHQMALTEIQPTTMAGVLALLTYLDDFRVQSIELPEDPTGYHSEESFLSELIDETILDKFNGRPIRLPYDFWIMRNVREALQSLAKQS